ncbi:hypothetical protein, partial [Escherichia coli]|uniref:hypothetical protein n=1 Tax=Escherichia coli TaxID=562 RepID=UPI001BEA7B60
MPTNSINPLNEAMTLSENTGYFNKHKCIAANAIIINGDINNKIIIIKFKNDLLLLLNIPMAVFIINIETVAKEINESNSMPLTYS